MQVPVEQNITHLKNTKFQNNILILKNRITSTDKDFGRTEQKTGNSNIITVVFDQNEFINRVLSLYSLKIL